MDAEEYLSVGRRADGVILLRVRLLATLAKLLRVQFKVGGWPYGASYERALNHQPRRSGVQRGVSVGLASASDPL